MNTLHALDLIGQFETAADDRTIVTLLRELSGRMGFDYFRLALIFPSTIQRRTSSSSTAVRRPGWIPTPAAASLPSIHRQVRHDQEHSILWADVVNDEARCDEQGREVMQLASEYGICDGITLPWHGANGHVGLLFITSTPRTQQQWLSAVPFISWLSMHIFRGGGPGLSGGPVTARCAEFAGAGGVSLGGGRQAGERYCPDPGDHSPYRDVSSEQCGQQAGCQQ
jgi:LuxR family quorum-sensing system transcriptional regulator SolR